MAVHVAKACTTTTLVIADGSDRGIQQLMQGASAPAQCIDPSRLTPLTWIRQTLEQKQDRGHTVNTLHLIAHGRPGAFRIGDVWIDAEALKTHAADLAHWGVETIALWSCHVGADAGFVALLAELTGARVLASADWLGRDGEGNQQLQLGEWKLGDLLEPKTWPASFRLAVSIEKADGSGICAEDELLFKATADANGYVSVTFDLNDEQPLPTGSQLWFSSTGEGDWQEYTNGYLEQLSGSSQGYFKVKLPDTTPKGTKLNAEIRQFEIDLGADNPVIDVGKLQLNADGAKTIANGIPGPAGEWSNGKTNDGKEYKLAYRYEDFLPQLKTLGYRLEADVGLKFSGDVQKYKFDDTEAFGAGGDAINSLKRLQTRLNGNRESGANVSHTMTFYLVDEFNKRTQVSLANFWVNPVDIDSFNNNANDSAEFFEIPDIGAAEEGSTDAANAGVIYELPTPLGGNGEKGPDSNNGLKNMIRFEKNGDLIRFHGARKWDAYNGSKNANGSNRSNVPGASVLLDYRDPVKELKFNVGTSGNTAVGADGSKRFFSTALGNAFTVGVPEGDFASDTDSITLEDCFDFYITPTAACIQGEAPSAQSVAAQSGEPLTDASFTFEVTGGKENGNKTSLEGVYAYEITPKSGRLGESYAGYVWRIEDAEGKAIDGISVNPAADEQEGKGTLTIEGDIEDFRVVFEVGSLALGDQLAGDESVTLKLTHQETTKADDATASLDDPGLECDPVESEQPSAFSITGTAACENEETESLTDASFTFAVKGVNPGGNSLDSLRGTYAYALSVDGKRVGSEYAGYSYRIEDKRGNQLDGKKIIVDPDGDGSKGNLDVKADLEEFRIIFDVGALVLGDQLAGDEEVRLEMTRLDTSFSASDVARLDDDAQGCDPVESNPAFTITATAACIKEEEDDTPDTPSAQNVTLQSGELLDEASFTFTVQGALDPGSRERDSLKGKYDYVLLVDGERVGTQYAGYDYRIEDINGKSLHKEVRVDEGSVGDGVGTLDVRKDISEFRVVFDVDALVEGDQLSGDEEVTLTLARQGTYANDYAYATASLADDDLDCDPLPNEREIFLEPFAACVKDGVLSDSTAEFIFKGGFKPATTETTTVDYIIDTSSGLLDGDYAFNLQLSDGISIKKGGAKGVLEVDQGVEDFSIEITASASDTLTGDESITLTLIDDGEVVTETASLDKLDCAPSSPPPEELIKTDVQLYLLMDNSTSMLQPDPSTTGASRRNRLESQDRVSLYAYQQALEKAGYGFSRKGESGVLTTDEFKNAVINNSAADLSNLLNDFEVIVDPDQEGIAEDLTVHLITYGYAVDYGSVTITANNPSAGTQAAQAIVGVLTPDQIYGNSILGNSLWSDRKLPNPTTNDTFWGEGRPASNLYSGTEMMGALEGLEHLLAAQLNRGAADPITTYISMTTDGRPERRAWWDTRKGPGSDSLTGQAVRLPDALGGDAITTSGLNYDNEGNHRFLLNNGGQLEWQEMQARLNNSLDAIAAQAVSAKDQLQVSVVGMGDGTDANFPAIYADLFGERTFINSIGSWDYEYFTSYALPDFVG